MPLTELNNIFTEEHNATYYDDLLANHKLIIRTVRNTNQKTVAKAINMSEPKFSAIYKLLLAYADKEVAKDDN